MDRMIISKQVLQVLKECAYDQSTLTPPTRVIPAKVYADFKKVITAAEGKWNSRARQFVFPKHVSPTAILGEIERTGKLTVRKQVYQEFFTPPELANKMACCINEHFATSDPMPVRVSVLEPSAGRGALVDAILGCTDNSWTWDICACEIQKINADCIVKDPRVRVCACDFLSHTSPIYTGSMNDGANYDAAIMNPPFTKKVWLDHIETALLFLRTNGVLVAVVPSSAKLSDLTFIGDKTNVHITPVPFADFADTGVKVSILTVGIPLAIVRAFFKEFQQPAAAPVDPEVLDANTPEQHIKAIRKSISAAMRELNALERELRS